MLSFHSVTIDHITECIALPWTSLSVTNQIKKYQRCFRKKCNVTRQNTIPFLLILLRKQTKASSYKLNDALISATTACTSLLAKLAKILAHQCQRGDCLSLKYHIPPPDIQSLSGRAYHFPFFAAINKLKQL